jgi:peptide/nickel transport system ATP-binding protein
MGADVAQQAETRRQATALVEVRDLCVTFGAGESALQAVDHVTFSMRRGERVALVGASGSGKTTLALAIPRLLPDACEVTGSVMLDGRELATERDLLAVRGRDIGVVYQDPLAALNPLMRLGDQVAEAIAAHQDIAPEIARAQALRWIERVGLDDPERIAHAYPHQLSGGMRQRIVIAMAVASRPALLVLDEPTTSLDTVTQAHVLALLDELQAELGFAVLLVTHDLSLARGRCERALCMSAGRITDDGPIETVLARLESTRALTDPPVRQEPAQREPLLVVRDLAVAYPRRGGFASAPAPRVLAGVSFDLRQGETLGLVGGSGAGKTTLARALLRLVEPSAGQVTVHTGSRGSSFDLLALDARTLRRVRPDIGIVFQDPAASLDPRRSVRDSLREALGVRDRTGRVLDDEARAWIERVGLAAHHLDRLPHQLSGGERQRVCISRALATSPRILVLDEALSSLDAAVRDEVLALLSNLRRERALASLFITHDLALVERFAERVAVLDAGRIVETGPTADVFAHPRSEITRALLAARAP